MLTPLLLGCLFTTLSMAIEVIAAVAMIRYLIALQARREGNSFLFDFTALIALLMGLFAGHLVQISLWAALFLATREFHDFATAFYHSAVNFTSLGYGDLVMSQRWRLLGALEAANGVLMFGLTAAAIFAVMARLFQQRLGEH